MRVRALAAAAALVAAQAAAGPVTVDADTLRRMAVAAEAAGADETAAAYAEALLARDPADVTARVIAARMARAAGDLRAARAHARAAWAAAATPGQRYLAAMTRAQALAASGNRIVALLWLRRAADLAPDPVARRIAIEDFGYVRARNRLTIDLAFSAAPSSNVNNGSRHDTILLFGQPFLLSPAARALAGGVVEGSIAVAWRLAEHERARTDLRLMALSRSVWISDPAGTGVDPGAFAYSAAEAGVVHRRRPAGGAVQLTFGATVGHNRHGGAPLSDYLRLEAGWDRPLAGGRHAILGIGAEHQWRHDDPRRDATVLSLRGGIVQRLASGDRLRLDAALRGTLSGAPEVGHAAAHLRLTWEKARPLAGMRVELGVGIEGRDYGRVPLAPAGRQDLRLDAALSVTFARATVMGFAPVLDLRASRQISSAPLYDGFDLGLGLGVRSVF